MTKERTNNIMALLKEHHYMKIYKILVEHHDVGLSLCDLSKKTLLKPDIVSHQIRELIHVELVSCVEVKHYQEKEIKSILFKINKNTIGELLTSF